jgi:hypothetical protein
MIYKAKEEDANAHPRHLGRYLPGTVNQLYPKKSTIYNEGVL